MSDGPRRRSTGTGGCCSRVAYQMLGSVADAEDVVQDTWLRWSAADRGDVADERAYLVQITTRLALDRLGSARARRESYVGPWLPEPLLTGGAPVASGPPAPEPDEAAELGEQVSLALLVVLETLSPGRAGGVRAARGLRDAGGRGGRRPGRSEAAVRQMAHRAREHVEARRPRFDTDRRAQREVTERFFAAVAGGDVEALLAVLAPDVVLISDGGGKAKAALRPITGADKVARFLRRRGEGLATSPTCGSWSPTSTAPRRSSAGSGDEPFGAVSLVVADGRVEQVLVVVNPEKLAGLVAAREPPRLRRVTMPPPRRPPSTSSARCACSPTPTTSTSAAPAPSRPGPRPAPRSPTASSPTATPAGSTRRRASRCGPLRRAEQQAAAAAVGVTDVRFLGYPDGRLELTLDLRRDISRVIRQVRPQRVLTSRRSGTGTAIGASHPDHMAVGEATLRAVYPDARNPFAFPELLDDEGLEAWTVSEVWLGASPRADHAVDVTDAASTEVRRAAAATSPR